MKILFLSDFVPTGKISLDSTFKGLINEADKVIFNLEGAPLNNTCFDEVNPIMPFDFGEFSAFLEQFNKDKFIIALANNHILDNGESGFDYLIKKLTSSDISFFGTKNKPFINIDGEVSVLNFVTAETVARYSSRKKLNYLFYDPSTINKQIKELEKKETDLILYPHWGRDMDRTIFDTYDLKLAEDKWHIFGHHPHVISGISKNKIYSLGNTFIPHPNYYKRYPAMHYGLAVMYDSATQDYTSQITRVVSNDGFKKDFTLKAMIFDEMPLEVLKHGEDYSLLKKEYHKILSFKGNHWDLYKLAFLQLMAKLFETKRKLRN